MKYSGITKTSFVNGEGARTVLWLSGCSHHCVECQNPDSWDASNGYIFTHSTEVELFSYIDTPVIDGLTLSGGDPLYVGNRLGVLKLCKNFKQRYSNKKTIWLYTGYLWEQVKDLEIMKYIDVLVDGPFMSRLSSFNFKYRGSSNQCIIDVFKSLGYGEKVLWE